MDGSDTKVQVLEVRSLHDGVTGSGTLRDGASSEILDTWAVVFARD